MPIQTILIFFRNHGLLSLFWEAAMEDDITMEVKMSVNAIKKQMEIFILMKK